MFMRSVKKTSLKMLVKKMTVKSVKLSREVPQNIDIGVTAAMISPIEGGQIEGGTIRS